MASCFRTVSSRLCCSSYLKTPGTLHLDTNNTSSLKTTQCNGLKKENYNFHASTSSCTSYVSGFNSLLLKNTLIPLSTNNVASQDKIMWYRPKNNLTQNLPPTSNPTYRNTLLSAKKVDKEISKDPPNYGRPSEEHLENVLQVLSDDLPRIFVKPLTWDIYHDDIIIENNIKGTTIQGIAKYATHVALFRTLAHLKFAHVKLFILKITKHPEEGTIKCRWQIRGIGGLESILFFWRLRPSVFADRVAAAPTWYDGFSIYYVGSDGKVFKHTIDKMMPDDDKVVEEKPSPVTKLALFLGLKSSNRSVVFINLLRDYLKEVSFSLKVIMPLEKVK